MKILKIFGVVVGIHVFALILIFANPGCSSTTRSVPAPTDTMPRSTDGGPVVSVPLPSNTVSLPIGAGATMAPSFNAEAPALAAGGVRYVPTRPGTPAASALNIEPVTDVTPATTYTVVNGDNLWSLGKKFNVTTADIAAANSLKTNAIIHPGQKLVIPVKPARAVAGSITAPAAGAPKGTEPAAARPATEVVLHVVKPGESLSAIAQQYGVRQGDIAVANNISDPQKIRAGMELTIPGWQPNPKSGRAAPKSAAKAPPPKASAPKAIVDVDDPVGGAQPPAPPPVPVIRVDDPIVPPSKDP